MLAGYELILDHISISLRLLDTILAVAGISTVTATFWGVAKALAIGVFKTIIAKITAIASGGVAAVIFIILVALRIKSRYNDAKSLRQYAYTWYADCKVACYKIHRK